MIDSKFTIIPTLSSLLRFLVTMAMSSEEKQVSMIDEANVKVSIEHVDDDDIDDLAPLIGSSPSALEIEGRSNRHRRHHHSTFFSWLPDSYKAMVFVVFVGLLAIPIAVVSFMFNTSGARGDVVWLPTCDLARFNQSFDELTLQVQGANQADLCIPTLMAQLGIHYGCPCSNPYVGVPVVNSTNYPIIGNRWDHAFELEKEIVANSRALSNLEVVFLGDSITEHWLGWALGAQSKKWENISKVYEDLFTTEGGGEIDGIVLGISGERCRNVLYRLQHELLGDDLDPKVFWLLIGTNDFGGDACTVEAVVAGNIAIVEELLRLRPHATVVINGLLPRDQFIWRHAAKVNNRLECYAAMTEGVDYFDAKDIFMLPNKTILHMPDHLHPDEEGHRLWGAAIVEKVLQIIDRS
jgi:lysophospholipase L1-like esterase